MAVKDWHNLKVIQKITNDLNGWFTLTYSDCDDSIEFEFQCIEDGREVLYYKRCNSIEGIIEYIKRDYNLKCDPKTKCWG